MWANNNIGGASVLLDTSPKIQVASCGGSSAERSNLDYCNEQQLAANQVVNSSSNTEQSDTDTAKQTTATNLPYGDEPVFNAIAQPQMAPITPQLQGTLSVLGHCDVSASCASVLIELLATPSLGLPYPDPTATNPIYVAPGSGFDLPPIFTSEPLKPIPEASTWVMTITGFAIMFFVFGKKRRPRINPISIIDVSGIC